MAGEAYRIRDWDKHFENSQSRKVDSLGWVRLPLKHDGLGFRRLIGMAGGIELYGAWVLIVQVAAKCPTRGTLADERGPLDAESLALKTGCPANIFQKALKALSRKEIGWLLPVGYQSATSRDPLEESREEEKREEENSCSETNSEPPVLTFPCKGKGPKTWDLSQAKLNEYLDCFPGIDQLAECKAALQWCRDNPTRRKTAGGMAGFLTRWLTKSQNRAGPSGPRQTRCLPPTDDELANWNATSGGGP